MSQLNSVDYGVIAVYAASVLALGMFLARRASTSLEDYYLAGRNMPWYLLGTSGMSMWFDVAGTMVICSFLYMLGPRGLFIEFRGGAVLVLAFHMCFVGKWHRRSQVMTGAEWMIFRFGKGPDAEAARMLKAITALLLTIGMIGYLVRGVGLFLSIFLPFSPTACALGLLVIATMYTAVSGFYGVVFTDLIQAVLIVLMSIVLSIIAFQMAPAADTLSELAYRITGNADWMSSMPVWKTTMPPGYEAYEYLLGFATFYLLRHILGGLGTGDEPKFFAARSDRDCGLLSMLVGWLTMVRWPLMMGLAMMGLFLVHRLYPDPAMVTQAAELISEYYPDTRPEVWHDVTSRIMNNPAAHPASLIEGLEGILGADWQGKMPLIGANGGINPERILPAVILEKIPMGFRGIILVALIAATMSTFDSHLNGACALFVRDIYQRWIRPMAPNRELIGASWTMAVVIVVLGFLFGLYAENINHIWGWIIMSLTAGSLGPAVLRLYWWRLNGWGVAGGLLLGAVAAVFQRLVFPDLHEMLQFAIMTPISVVGAVVGSLITAPTSIETLENFFRKTRPFGFWGPVRARMSGEDLEKIDQENLFDVLAVPFALLWQVTLFLLPMQLIIKSYGSFFVTLPIFLVGLIGLYFLWYRRLEPRDVADGKSQG